MKVLVVGGGGREHAMAWRIAQSPNVQNVYCCPGNAGTAMDVSSVPGNITKPQEMAALAGTLGVTYTVVGPEAPLVAGIVNEFEARGLAIVGPSRLASRLEGSKVFTKDFLREINLPTAEYVLLEEESQIGKTISRFGYPVALKADGLAAGKGVVIVQDEQEALACARRMLAGELVGDAGRRIVVEQFLSGEEVSFMVLADGESYCVLPATQDHKRALDGDEGPNTGGMGAYCDASILTAEMQETIVRTIIEPTLEGMLRRGTRFSGFLYCGLIMTSEGPKVLEFNVRLGDPETQPMMLSMEGDFAGLLETASRGALDSSLISSGRLSAASVVLASGGYPGKYASGRLIKGLHEAESTGAKVFHAGTKLSGGQTLTAGGRVLAVTAAGGDLKQALKKTYSAVEAVSFEGAHYRRDIGYRGLQRLAVV